MYKKYVERTPEEWYRRKRGQIEDMVMNFVETTTRYSSQERVDNCNSGDDITLLYEKYARIFDMLDDIFEYDADFDAEHYGNTAKKEYISDMKNDHLYDVS